jgi:hypothetical protein
MIEYRGFGIECNQKPIPDRQFDCDIWKLGDDDGPLKFASSIREAKEEIDRLIEEGFYNAG